MQKIVINRCYGGYSLSEEAAKYLGEEYSGCCFTYEEDRANPKLIECVETLGEKANGMFSDLKVVAIPDDVEWEIEEYDGIEWIAEKHRTWR